MNCDMHLRVLQFWKARSLQKQYTIDEHSVSRVDTRYYQLSAFGTSDYDRDKINSDLASGTVLGRVAGTERWGASTTTLEAESKLPFFRRSNIPSLTIVA